MNSNFFRIQHGGGIHKSTRVYTGNKGPHRDGEMPDHDGKRERGIVHCDQSGIFRPVRHATRHQNGCCFRKEELAVVFLVSEETHVMRSSGIERGHACQRQVEPAPDDVTIDPSGELGKCEGDGQQRMGRKILPDLLRRSSGHWNLWLRLTFSRKGVRWGVLVEILQQTGGDVGSVLGVE